MKKYLIFITAALAAFFVALMKAFKLGQKSERNKQMHDDFHAGQTRLEVENDINQKDDDSVRRDLAKWVRDE